MSEPSPDPDPTPATPPLSEQDFQALLARARAGDDEAVDQLVRRSYPRVERMVHASLSRDLRDTRPWLRTRFSTRDVVQEVFQSLTRDLGAFQGRSEQALLGYLAMITRNRLLDAIRYHEASRRDGRRTTRAPDTAHDLENGATPVELAISDEELGRYRVALDTFPERERLLLRARIEESASFESVAEILGYSSMFAARRAYFAARAKLVVRLGLREDA